MSASPAAPLTGWLPRQPTEPLGNDPSVASLMSGKVVGIVPHAPLPTAMPHRWCGSDLPASGGDDAAAHSTIRHRPENGQQRDRRRVGDRSGPESVPEDHSTRVVRR
jgi:hypothetical protein